MSRIVSDKKIDYLEYSIQNGLPKKIAWIASLFGYIVEEKYENEFIKKDGKLFYGKTKESGNILLDNNYQEPIFYVNDKIDVSPGFLPNIHEPITTTAGRIIINYLLLVVPFYDKIPYINKQFSISDIEDITKKKLTDDPSDKNGILVAEYIKFVDMVTYIKNLNKIVSKSATEHTIIKPPGIDEYKKKLIEEYTKKYGKDALKKKTIAAEIEQKIKEYEIEYLKKDPGYGSFLVGSIIGAHKKMYASYGVGLDFYPKPTVNYLTKSLYDGYDKDRGELTTLFNDAILGSYSRAVETMKGGLTAKISLRATNDIKVLNTDCGTKLYLPVTVTNSNKKQFIGRYMFDDNMKPIEITDENIDKLIGKTIKLRSPLFCKTDRHYCKYCMSKEMGTRENAIALLITDMAGIILNESMKAMHNTETKLTEIDLKHLFT